MQQRADLADWLRKKGKRIPERLQQQEPSVTDLDADLVPVWNAWCVLMDGRSVQEGEGLSWAECSRWCEDHEIHGEERRRYCRLLKAIDRAYVAHISEVRSGDAGTSDRRERDAARGAAGGAGPARRAAGKRPHRD